MQTNVKLFSYPLNILLSLFNTLKQPEDKESPCIPHPRPHNCCWNPELSDCQAHIGSIIANAGKHCQVILLKNYDNPLIVAKVLLCFAFSLF